MVDQQRVADDLEAFLAWNPPRLTSRRPLDLTTPPHFFYSKHIDPRLSLDHVVSMPSLVPDLADIVSDYSDRVLESALYTKLPSKSLSAPIDIKPHKRFVGGWDVADFYDRSTARICTAVATKLFLIPSMSIWRKGIFWGHFGRNDPIPVDETASLQFDTEFDPDFEPIAEDMLRDVQRAAAFAPKIGTWLFLAVSAESESLLTNLGRLCSPHTFAYNHGRTTSHCSSIYSPRPIPPDASSAPWSLPSAGKSNEVPVLSAQRRSTRLNNSSSPSARAEKSTRVIPGRLKKSASDSDSKLTAEALLQLGWARAIERDSTFIIFNCGNFERIGIRHRETRTLYLSDLIDVTACENPGYAKIQVGVTIALMLDTICRAKDAERARPPLQTSPRRSPRKRSRVDTQMKPQGVQTQLGIKRRKTKHRKRSEDENQTAPKLASQCNLMLVRIEHDIYHSPVPASFIRSAPSLAIPGLSAPSTSVKRAYQQHEYFSVTLTSRIGDGATGIVHSAILSATSKEGDTFEDSAVVKFAFLKDQQRRMRHEYEVYQHLTNHGVTGVPQVYGMFEDLEGGPIALVMRHCGKTLRRLKPDDVSLESFLTAAQRDRFIAILESIHEAGVRHCDIRVDNLMLTDAGDPVIIDFDRGRFNPIAVKKEWEMTIMKNALRGIPHNFSARSPGPYDGPTPTEPEEPTGRDDSTSDSERENSDSLSEEGEEGEENEEGQ
ncbi:hypothetical protein C8R45DRAFT_1003556 [Mycena sanguinolenta]|nr:hypothetical protein C8R45DRAFT_1003556 [Mycena sanguinolenta]